MHVKWSRLAIPAIGFAALVLATPDAAAQLSQKQAEKQFSNAAKSEVKILKDQLAAIHDEYCLILDSILADALALEITPDEAIELATELNSQYAGLVRVAAFQRLTNLAAFGTSLAFTLGFVPPTWLVGNCGAIDDFLADVKSEVDKATDRGMKKLKKFRKKLQKGLEYVVYSLLFPLLPFEPVPAAGGMLAPEPTVKDLVVDSIGAGSNAVIASDGKICVAGTGDPASAVTVTITAPDGGTETAMATPDVTNCRFSVCFPDDNAGDLLEGPYSVRIQQGDTTIDTAIGVP